MAKQVAKLKAIKGQQRLVEVSTLREIHKVERKRTEQIGRAHV